MLESIFPSDLQPVTLIWYIAHGILFAWFSLFISPMKHSDRSNVTYFWTISFSSLLLLIASICHAPRLFHSHSTELVDIVAFSWTVLPFTGVWLEIVSKISKRAVGYSITSPVRVWLSNSLLVTIALSLQYMTCLESGFFHRYRQPSKSVFLDISYVHCSMMESPFFISIPIILTAILLFFISHIVGRVFGTEYKFFQSRHRRHVTSLFDSPGSDQPRPVQTPMVPWFSLSLTATAIQLLVSLKIFVGRLDIRHILNAVCKEESDIVFDLRSMDTWYDFFADGGDGFNSSYTVARLMAQPNLTVHIKKSFRQSIGNTNLTSPVTDPLIAESKADASPQSVASMVVQRRTTMVMATGISPDKSDTLLLPRASVAIHGGDLAYPRPNNEVYRTRFVGPIEAAFPAGPGGGVTRPRMFIIPGNHDHYDGLESFVHWIIGKGSLGGWKLPQKSSYFALQLKHGWWILGMDIGLTDDVDVFQYQTFLRIIDERIGENDRVVVLTHRPQWVFDPYHDVVTGDMFHQLLDRVGPSRLAMRLAGDIHHYTRYSGGHTLPPLVTSGGGGAFLHPTHIPESNIVHQYFQERLANKRERLVESDDDSSSSEDDEQDGLEPDSPINASRGIKKSRSKKFSSHPVMAGGVPSNEYHKYKRVSAFPAEETSRKLAWLNIVAFRNKNWGADIIFGTIYCCMGLSVLPICGANQVLESISQSESILVAVHQIVTGLLVPAIRSVYTESILSLTVHVLFFFICWSAAADRNVYKQFAIAFTHYICHAMASMLLFVLMELAITFLSQVSEGKDSIISDGFRVPGIVESIDRDFFGSSHKVVEQFLNSFLRFSDFPSSLIRNRQPICQLATAATREGMFRYMWRVIPFIWVVATPVAAAIMGIYLFINVNYLGLHLNEAFSSLRIEDYKNFLRMHIDDETGDLHVYVIGIENVAKHWEEDPSWDPFLFKDTNVALPPSTKWVTPSRWRPLNKYSQPQLVDYFIVPKIPSSNSGLVRTNTL